jgi:hypothetical protein
MGNLKQTLKDQRSAILQKWLQSILETYPSDAAKFMQNQKDKFHNPVGQTFNTELEVLFDELFLDMNKEKIYSSLDNIVRIRAVQDFSPSQAVTFLFQLKSILLDEIFDLLQDDSNRKEYFVIIAKIDHLILATFDIYSKCREKIFDIRLKEMKKWSTGIFENKKSPDQIST